MENCAVKATIDASAEKSFMVGGLTGHAGNYDRSNPTLIRNCSADVDITVSPSALLMMRLEQLQQSYSDRKSVV